MSNIISSLPEKKLPFYDEVDTKMKNSHLISQSVHFAAISKGVTILYLIQQNDSQFDDKKYYADYSSLDCSFENLVKTAENELKQLKFLFPSFTCDYKIIYSPSDVRFY